MTLSMEPAVVNANTALYGETNINYTIRSQSNGTQFLPTLLSGLGMVLSEHHGFPTDCDIHAYNLSKTQIFFRVRQLFAK